MKNLYRFFGIVMLLSSALQLSANNLNITNVSLTGATSSTIQVQYNMFWENSWRDAENWDATWVFIKYSTNNGNTWEHATLSPSGHVAGTASPTPSIQIPQDNLGAFVYRSSQSTGTFTITGQQLQWNFVANGLNQSQASSAEIRVFGMEMVYIPQGPFALGDGVNYTGTPNPSFNAYRRNFTSRAVYVTDVISDSIQDPQFGFFRTHGLNGIDLNMDGVVGTWPTDAPDFPIGYKAIYCMKYKVTQGQYCDFLNTLTYTQQSSRVNSTTNTVGQSAWDGSTTTLPANRFNIFVQIAGVSPSTPRIYTATRPDRYCNLLNWPDAAAYADWAALRPMTDMEREKIGRGPLPPVQGEYADGLTSINSLTALTTGNENGQETSTSTSNTGFNIYNSATISGGDGSFNRAPIRAGIFARSSTSRTQSGSSYYGVMDLTSDLIEFTVSFSTLAGRSFTGLHGNGLLDVNGFANQNFWPGINGNSSYTSANTTFGSTGVTSGAGIMFTGSIAWNGDVNSGPQFGSSYNFNTIWSLSSKFNISFLNIAICCSSTSTRLTSYTSRYQQVGFRGVKSNL